MGRKSEPLKVEIFLSLNGKDGPYKPWNECTPEEIARFQKGVSEKMSRNLSDYYSNHPDEYRKLLEAKNAKESAEAL